MSMFVLKFILLFICITTVLCTNDSSTEDLLESNENFDYIEDNVNEDGGMDITAKAPQDAAEFMDYIEELIKGTKGKLEEMIEKHLPRILQMSTSVQLSSRCTHDLLQVLFGLRELKPWAIKLLDASGKLPDGVLQGTFTSLGSYDECLDIKLHDDRFNETELSKGQYCGLSIAPLLPPKPQSTSIERVFNEAADAKGYPKEDHISRLAPFFYFLKFRFGVCVPSSCSIADLTTIAASLSNNLRVNVTVVNCEVKQNFHLSKEQIVTGSVLVSVVILVIFSTIVDIYWSQPNTKSLLRRLCVSFSAYSNSCDLLSTRPHEECVKPLYGLRVISLIWVILANSYVTLDLKLVGNLLKTREVYSQLLFQAVINASLAVETFFFISGLLISFVTLKKLKSASNWNTRNWLWFYFRRWIRLTPALMFVIVLVLFTVPMKDGPFWAEIIGPSADRCRRNWWIHFLHISNFFDISEMCFLHLWYISADFQLFLFTPFLLMLLFKKPRTGKYLIFTLISASVVSTGIVTYLQHIPPTLLFANPDPISRKTYGNKMLIKPYPHAACYLIGILVGYLLENSSQIKIKNIIAYIGWIATTVVCFSALIITWHWNRGHTPTPLVSAVYAAFSRSLWSLAMAWIVYACYLGRGGIIRDILCWSVFKPLSKLSYMAYLIHPGLMFLFVASTRSIFTFSHFLIVHLFFAYLISTFSTSFFLTLLFEKPFINLEKILQKCMHKEVENTVDTNGQYLYSVNETESSVNITLREKPAYIYNEKFTDDNNGHSLTETCTNNKLSLMYDYKL